MRTHGHGLCAGIVLLLAIVSVSPALGCAGEHLPEGLRAVMGRSETDPATLTSSMWRVTRDGVELKELPADYALAVGECGSTVAYSDLQTGQLHLWHPGKSSPDDVSTVELPSGGVLEGDVMALSPDESTLALVRYSSPEEAADSAGSDGSSIRSYMVDLLSGRVDSWEWLDAVAQGYQVTALRWSKTSDAVFVSLGLGGGSQGERSYRYSARTKQSTELQGVATVLDVGLQGQVVGLGSAATPSDLDQPAGSTYGSLPLVLYSDEGLVRLPRDPSLVAWDFAWISDDGNTIVVRGSAADAGEQRPCLEVLRLGDAGWRVSWIYSGEGSLSVQYGVAFEPNSDIFCFQAGLAPTTPGAAVTEVGLFELETSLKQVYQPALPLPGGAAGNYVQALGISGAHTRAASCPSCR
jgi:hypothetical protein